MENKMEVEVGKLLEGFGKFPECETCKRKDCKGKLDYNDLCGNINYLRMYGKANYENNRETFLRLKKIMGDEKPAIFSFGCGLGLDYLGAEQAFGNSGYYYPIEECKWAIMDTNNYKGFEPPLPRSAISFEKGLALLARTQRNAVICFFHSLYTIARNTDLRNELLSALKFKENFYLVCNFTINSHFGPVMYEREFIDDLAKDLRDTFVLKKVDIIGGRGIIIQGKRK